VQDYRAGTLSTVEMKDTCIKKLQEVVAEFQKVSQDPPLSGRSSVKLTFAEPSRGHRRDGQAVPRCYSDHRPKSSKNCVNDDTARAQGVSVVGIVREIILVDQVSASIDVNTSWTEQHLIHRAQPSFTQNQELCEGDESGDVCHAMTCKPDT
jgi:hypothetical protein